MSFVSALLQGSWGRQATRGSWPTLLTWAGLRHCRRQGATSHHPCQPVTTALLPCVEEMHPVWSHPSFQAFPLNHTGKPEPCILTPIPYLQGPCQHTLLTSGTSSSVSVLHFTPLLPGFAYCISWYRLGYTVRFTGHRGAGALTVRSSTVWG